MTQALPCFTFEKDWIRLMPLFPGESNIKGIVSKSSKDENVADHSELDVAAPLS